MNQNLKEMKGLIYTFLVLLGLTCVCVVTCPNKSAHSEALKNLLNTVMTEEMNNSVETDEDAGWAMLGSMIGTGIGGLMIDNMLKVENYFVCSVGTMTFDGETKIVSLGLMNHVFTISEDEAKEAASDLL